MLTLVRPLGICVLSVCVCVMYLSRLTPDYVDLKDDLSLIARYVDEFGARKPVVNYKCSV